jgi:hypothetical protein
MRRLKMGSEPRERKGTEGSNERRWACCGFGVLGEGDKAFRCGEEGSDFAPRVGDDGEDDGDCVNVDTAPSDTGSFDGRKML